VKATIEEEIVKYDIVPSEIRTNVNKSQSVKVTGTYKNGKTIALASRIKWTIENEKVATVRGATVKGVAIGSTKLVGEYQGRKLEVTVHVKPRLLKLEANPTTVKLGSNVKIKASRGSVQGVSKGSGSLKLTLDGKSTSLRVTVK